ncbi:DUF5829 family protein [Pedobacter sp. Hv1]|uniref:DUF5829 family protein n=1 Tax=Pedobacter sp. Hv1 TaxID=1740090 RepID=UPI0006D8C3C5|nr:DUF5829 family protein [Pedobacter sp. Hv1]KQC00332.1 hypothetical protein AQF98_12655 [Pedobacter sp. Hv1]
MKLKLILLALSFPLIANAQKPKVDLNTIFVCIDSTTYAQLFKNAFVKDTLFFCKEQQTQTNLDSYNGKYAIGQAATLDFFRPVHSKTLGDKFGDLGIEFKTRKLKDLQTFINLAKLNKATYHIDTTKFEQEKQAINWYKEFTLNTNPAKENFEISILEYQPAYLKLLGFTPKEIAQSMSYQTYNAKLAKGRKYPRQFQNINYINLTINAKELAYVKKMANLLGLVEKGTSFVSADLTIVYHIKSDISFRVNKIGINLIDNFAARSISVSDHMKIDIIGHKATLAFDY